MILYWVLLLITAFLAYFFGSLDSRVIASVFVFHSNLAKLGRGNVWISNFRRIYGIMGFVKLFLVELIKDLLPLLIGGWLLAIKGHGDVGRAFAGFCLVLGNLYPAIYRFKGGSAIIALPIAAICMKSSVGVAVAIVALFVVAALRYVSLGAVVAALAMIIVGVLELENSLVTTLCIMTSALVIIKHIPAIRRVLNGHEPRIQLINDISYKFDEKF